MAVRDPKLSRQLRKSTEARVIGGKGNVEFKGTDQNICEYWVEQYPAKCGPQTTCTEIP